MIFNIEQAKKKSAQKPIPTNAEVTKYRFKNGENQIGERTDREGEKKMDGEEKGRANRNK